LFGIGPSLVLWRFGKPQFVLLWLLCLYVTIGLVETLRALPELLRRRQPEQVAAASSLEQDAPRDSKPAPQG
jgi:hypothetical protein